MCDNKIESIIRIKTIDTLTSSNKKTKQPSKHMKYMEDFVILNLL
ncbi:hypothetical protein TUM17387_14470 [Shewanella carassii]|nr:hypothetical protein TUM17387_14470 [Shewanella carassii]